MCLMCVHHCKRFRQYIMIPRSLKKNFKYLRPKGTNPKILGCRNFCVPLGAYTFSHYTFLESTVKQMEANLKSTYKSLGLNQGQFFFLGSNHAKWVVSKIFEVYTPKGTQKFLQPKILGFVPFGRRYLKIFLRHLGIIIYSLKRLQ